MPRVDDHRLFIGQLIAGAVFFVIVTVLIWLGIIPTPDDVP